MPDTYSIKGALTFPEYLECHKILAAKRRLWIRGVLLVIAAGLLVYGALQSPTIPDPAYILPAIILPLSAFVISPHLFRRRVRRNWDRYPAIRKDMEITVTAEGIDSLDDKGNPSHMAWSNFIRFRESKSLFLLHLSPLLPLCLPKRLVPEEDLPGLRQLLSLSIQGG